MVGIKKCYTFALGKRTTLGAIAQLVEQRTENPCVPGSIPGGTTSGGRCIDFYFGKVYASFFCINITFDAKM